MSHRWARQLVVTVSVEPDDPAVAGRTGAYRSLDGLGRFQELCRRCGVRPTYLLTFSASQEAPCVELIRSAGDELEAGAHLHPEETPPIAEAERDNTVLRPSEVEPERLRAKLRSLADAVAEAAGRPPTAFRSGFFGLTAAQAATLVELGIEADSSLGPLEKTREGYPFLRAPFEPYVMDPNDVCRVLDADSGTRNSQLATRNSELATRNSQLKRLVEVPMTSVFRRPFPRAFFGAFVALPGRVRGALRRLGLADVLRFRPAAASAEELLAVCERTERLGIPAVMTLHSNELVAGASTTVATEAASAAYFERLERTFAWAHERGWRSRTLTEVAREEKENA